MKKILSVLFVLLSVFLILIFDDMFVSYKETKTQFLKQKEELNLLVDFILSQKSIYHGYDVTIDVDTSIFSFSGNECVAIGSVKDDCSVDIKNLYTVIQNKLKDIKLRKVVITPSLISVYFDREGIVTKQSYVLHYNISSPVQEYALSCFQQKIINGNRYYMYANGNECDG